MVFEIYEKNFKLKAYKAGYSEDEIQKCLSYAKPLIERKLPVIYNTANLCALVGYNKSYVKRAVLFTSSFYRSFTIKKKNSNNVRYLSEPLPSLKEIQLWILENILYRIPVSKFAKAYIPKRNILDNVKFHKNKKLVVNLDIKDFFSSIKRTSVEDIFRNLGYSSNVANLLSKLCCHNEILPQGCPTSPYLSNIYLLDFDRTISLYCVENEIRYSRYADDLTFSGDFDHSIVINLVEQKLFRLQLSLNRDKVKIFRQNDRQTVTGIVVNKIIQTPKYDRAKIRQEVYYLKKYGLNDHLIKTNNRRSNYILHLLGKINYTIYVNPNDSEMKEYKEFIYDTYLKENL